MDTCYFRIKLWELIESLLIRVFHYHRKWDRCFVRFWSKRGDICETNVAVDSSYTKTLTARLRLTISRWTSRLWVFNVCTTGTLVRRCGLWIINWIYTLLMHCLTSFGPSSSSVVNSVINQNKPSRKKMKTEKYQIQYCQRTF